jgi:5-enolpyruvylshikimate-3-phosphate synthase
MDFEFKRLGPLRGELTVPADKSISHRAVILASLAKGESVVQNISWGMMLSQPYVVCASWESKLSRMER